MKKHIEKKLDGGLRRILNMSDSEIRSAKKRENRRISKIQRRLKLLKIIRPEEDTADLVKRERQVRFQPAWGAVKFTRKRLKPVAIRAIVHFGGNKNDLMDMGLKVRSQAHDIFTIEGTPEELRTLASQAATFSLRLPRILLPTVEDASAQAGIADVHQGRPANPTGYEGQGIIVGIIDSPLDVRHPTFREAASPHDTRVLYYWVQSPDSTAAPGQTPEDFNNVFNDLDYGILYTQTDIDNALGNSSGTYGNGNNQISKELSTTRSEHGTHTAGIAVGNGHDASYSVGAHVGAATEATLIHVNPSATWAGLANGAYEDHLIDAIDFIFRAADFHGMRAVVSVSLGTNLGPHDGTSLFDQQRDNLLNSFNNRSIVWSAGNDNNDDGFTHGSIAASTTISISLTSTLSPLDGNTNIFLDIWYKGPDLEAELRRGASTSGWITSGNEFHGQVSGRTVDIDRDPEPSSGYKGLRFYIQATNANQTWTINLRNPDSSDNVAYWAWAGIQGQHADINNPDHDVRTISDTGCGRSILTVGACDKISPVNLASGEPITAYSAAGPTMDNRIKPEITAVGGTLANPIISAGTLTLNSYVGMFGTSMATPLVAGLVALIMEERQIAGSDIDQDTIKSLLIQYANRLNLDLDPLQPGYDATERNLYGYGRVRAIGCLDHHLPPQNVDVYVKTAPDDYGLMPYLGDVYWAAPEVRIFPQGSSTETNVLQWGHTYDVVITVRNRGDDAALGTEVWLKYARPHTAPSDWHPAEDTSDTDLHTTVDVPALGQAEAHFVWRPDHGEITPPYPDNHFCVLTEISHVSDVLSHPSASGGGSAWNSNIRNTNNIALHNINIQ